VSCSFYEHLVEGKLYYISRASLKPANKRFTSVAHDYEMTLNSDTQIERADEEELAASGKKVTIPTAKFNFCKLSELIGEHGVDSLVDVVGVVHNHQPVQEITARSTGKVSTKRELQIVDDSNTQVAVTLWGKDAAEFEQYLDLDGGHPVLVLKGGRITEFQQKVQVGALQSSSLLVNPANVQEVANLRNWYDYEGGSSQSFVPLINSGGATNTGATFLELTPANVRNPDARWRLLKDVNANSASGNDAYFFTKAVVHSALKKDCTACTALALLRDVRRNLSMNIMDSIVATSVRKRLLTSLIVTCSLRKLPTLLARLMSRSLMTLRRLWWVAPLTSLLLCETLTRIFTTKCSPACTQRSVSLSVFNFQTQVCIY